MAEDEKKAFVKTVHLTDSEVQKIVTDEYGMQLKLKDVKDGNHIVMKILEPIVQGEYAWGGKQKETYKLKCKYKPKGCEPFELRVQIGEGPANRLWEKFPDDKYVGMYAFFSKTSHDGKFPQFVNPIEHYNGDADKEDAFTKTADKPETQADSPETAIKLDLSNFDEFKETYLNMCKEDKTEPALVHMVGSYITSSQPDTVVELIKKCEEVLKK